MADPNRVRTHSDQPDMDLPLMRAAEAYLTYAPTDKYVKESVTQILKLEKNNQVFKYKSAELTQGKIVLSGLIKNILGI